MFEQPLNCKLNANEKIKLKKKSLIIATQNQILRATLKALCFGKYRSHKKSRIPSQEIQL